MKKIFLQVFVLMMLFSFNVTAQTNNIKQKFNKKEIDSYIKSEMKAGQIPGLTYAVVMNGKIIDSGAFGVANVELNSPASIHTKFAIGSIGKTFTATAVMLLVKERKLSLDDPINKYLDSLPDTWNSITIRHLLSHTSGIKDYAHDFPGYTFIERRDRKQEYKEAEFIRMATEVPLNFNPGERYAYSNSNFVLLGFIVRKVSGKTLPEFMKEHVFDPIGMAETVYMTQTDIIANRAHGYLLDSNNKLINGNYISDFFSSTGDMGVTTTAGDMAKWSLALDSGKFLDKSTLAQMWTPSKLKSGAEVNFFGDSYGLGWEILDYRGCKVIGHGGSFMNGYSADYYCFTDYNITIIVLTNLNNPKSDGMSSTITGFFVPGLSGIDHLKPVVNADTNSVKKINLMLKQIINDNLDTSLVTTGFKQRMNPITKLVIGYKDPLPSVSYISSDMVASKKLMRYGIPIEKINYYKLQFPHDNIYLSVYMTADNKIADWIIDNL